MQTRPARRRRATARPATRQTPPQSRRKRARRKAPPAAKAQADADESPPGGEGAGRCGRKPPGGGEAAGGRGRQRARRTQAAEGRAPQRARRTQAAGGRAPQRARGLRRAKRAGAEGARARAAQSRRALPARRAAGKAVRPCGRAASGGVQRRRLCHERLCQSARFRNIPGHFPGVFCGQRDGTAARAEPSCRIAVFDAPASGGGGAGRRAGRFSGRDGRLFGRPRTAGALPAAGCPKSSRRFCPAARTGLCSPFPPCRCRCSTSLG